MRKKVEKKSKFRILKISNIAICVVLLYFIHTVAEQQISLNKYNSQIETYEKQIAQKEDSLKFYTVDKETETTDEYYEKIARESLGLVKPYEKIYVDISK